MLSDAGCKPETGLTFIKFAELEKKVWQNSFKEKFEKKLLIFSKKLNSSKVFKLPFKDKPLIFLFYVMHGKIIYSNYLEKKMKWKRYVIVT